MKVYLSETVLTRWRDPKIRNYGLGSRCPRKAVLNFTRHYYKSFSTGRQVAGRFSLFWDFLEARAPEIQDLRGVSRATVELYAAHLKNLVLDKLISIATAQNYLSAVNAVMAGIRGDSNCTINPIRDAQLPQRSAVSKTSKAVIESQILAFKFSLPYRLRILSELQLNFGLRFEESAKANPKVWFQEAKRSGVIKIVAGTKGGRPRTLNVARPEDFSLLESAAKLQGKHHSLVPGNLSYAAFRRFAYRQLNGTGVYRTTFHQLRHTYAQDRYRAITGFPCPVSTGNSKKTHRAAMRLEHKLSSLDYLELDRTARQSISEELGHCRLSISSAYVG